MIIFYMSTEMTCLSKCFITNTALIQFFSRMCKKKKKECRFKSPFSENVFSHISHRNVTLKACCFSYVKQEDIDRNVTLKAVRLEKGWPECDIKRRFLADPHYYSHRLRPSLFHFLQNALFYFKNTAIVQKKAYCCCSE